ALARMHLCGGSEHGHEVVLAAHLDAQHAEAGLGAVERDALDEPRQWLSASVLTWPHERCPMAATLSLIGLRKVLSCFSRPRPGACRLSCGPSRARGRWLRAPPRWRPAP